MVALKSSLNISFQLAQNAEIPPCFLYQPFFWKQDALKAFKDF